MVFTKETTFTKRIKSLLNLYKMAAWELQEYCNVLYPHSPFYKGAMTYWVRGTRQPSNDAIRRIADFFGVSSFWLKGSEDYFERYVYDTTFASLEEYFFENYPDLSNELVSKEYLKLEVRKTYPAEARANIIVLLNIVYCERKLSSIGKPPTDIIKKIRFNLAPERIKEIISTKQPIFKLYQ